MDNFTGEKLQKVDNGKIVINYVLGKKDGITKFINKDDLVLSEINYKDDIIDGEVKQYYNSGNILSIINYKNGVQNGGFVSFYENSMKQIETNYLNGEIDGLFCVYDEFGDKLSECTYKNGKKHGKSLVYYPKTQGGNIYELSYYENNLINGDRVTFYKTGEVMSVTSYIKGKAQTYTKNYSINGDEV